jgi:hypothetical protein
MLAKTIKSANLLRILHWLAFQVIDEYLMLHRQVEATWKNRWQRREKRKGNISANLGLKIYKTAEKLTASAFESIEAIQKQGYFLRILAKTCSN